MDSSPRRDARDVAGGRASVPADGPSITELTIEQAAALVGKPGDLDLN